MLFNDLIRDLRDGVVTAVDELFSAAYAHQAHPQDLLLVDQHGFYSEALANAPLQGQSRLSPYVIGPDKIGFANSTFYKFVDWFRNSRMFDKSEWEQRLAHNVQLQEDERLTVQVEQSIYLRFWEADSLLKQYCQLSSLAVGQPYDWHVTIPSYSREGSKHEFVRKQIRDRVRSVCPNFYALVNENYQTQIRDAIAHSQFYIVGRTIGFTNYSPNPAAHAPLTGISFDDWYRRFHTTLLLHNETIGAFRRYRKSYEEKALDDGNRIEVRIIARDGSMESRDLALHANGRWVWRTNLCR